MQLVLSFVRCDIVFLGKKLVFKQNNIVVLISVPHQLFPGLLPPRSVGTLLAPLMLGVIM